MQITILKQLNHWIWKLVLSGREYKGSALTSKEALTSAFKFASYNRTGGKHA